MSEKRDWSDQRYTQARAEAEELERQIRHILRLFAEGCLVYRPRTPSTHRSRPVQTKSDRLKRVRRALTSAPAEPGEVGGTAIA